MALTVMSRGKLREWFDGDPVWKEITPKRRKKLDAQAEALAEAGVEGADVTGFAAGAAGGTAVADADHEGVEGDADVEGEEAEGGDKKGAAGKAAGKMFTKPKVTGPTITSKGIKGPKITTPKMKAIKVKAPKMKAPKLK